MPINIYRMIGILIAVTVCLIDQVTKHHMRTFFQGHQFWSGRPIETINPYFDYVLAWNKGISFSMLNNYGSVGRIILIAVACIICIILVRWLTKSTVLSTCVGTGMILGGAIGNIVDRIKYGAVIDFLHIHYKHWSWPAFNFADTFICIGVAFVIFENFFKSKGTLNEND